MLELKSKQEILTELEQIQKFNLCAFVGYYTRQEIFIKLQDDNGNTFNKLYYVPSKFNYVKFNRILRKLYNGELNKCNMLKNTI